MDSMETYNRVTAQIDLDAIAYNFQQIRDLVSPKSDVLPVVKADAYGHGALEVAQILIANGARRLAVAILDEAVLLRQQGIDIPILILGYTDSTQADELARYDLAQTVFAVPMAEAISKAALRNNRKIKVHIKIDTGMGRVGFYPDSEAVEVVKSINCLPGIEIEGIYTHLSSADDEDKSFTYKQIATFLDFTGQLDEAGVHIPLRHVANSACIIDVEEGYLELVRPGLILYGLYPSDSVQKQKLPLKPAMSLTTHVVHIKTMEPGMPISYGRTYYTERVSRIATIPVGYADGFPRRLSSKGRVIINGHYAPIVGRICMDQFMVDVTDIPDVKVCDRVVLMGRQGDLEVSAEEIAGIVGTINYEVVCRVGKRIPRVYSKKNCGGEGAIFTNTCT